MSYSAVTVSNQRLHRAEKYANQLEERVVAYFGKQSRIHVEGRFDALSSCYIFAARLYEELPLEWGLILSDMAHQLRAALDNLVCGLILHRHGIPSKSSQFPPIFQTKPEYDGWRRPIKKRRQDPLQGLSKIDIDLIEQFQTWHPKSNWRAGYLSDLQWMSNKDKHILVHPTPVFMSSYGDVDTTKIFPFLFGPDGTLVNITRLAPEKEFAPIKDVASVGKPVYHKRPLTMTMADIITVPITPNGPDPQLKMAFPLPRIAVTERELELHSMASGLYWLRRSAHEVLKALRPQFE